MCSSILKNCKYIVTLEWIHWWFYIEFMSRILYLQYSVRIFLFCAFQKFILLPHFHSKALVLLQKSCFSCMNNIFVCKLCKTVIAEYLSELEENAHGAKIVINVREMFPIHTCPMLRIRDTFNTCASSNEGMTTQFRKNQNIQIIWGYIFCFSSSIAHFEQLKIFFYHIFAYDITNICCNPINLRKCNFPDFFFNYLCPGAKTLYLALQIVIACSTSLTSKIPQDFLHWGKNSCFCFTLPARPQHQYVLHETGIWHSLKPSRQAFLHLCKCRRWSHKYLKTLSLLHLSHICSAIKLT